MGFLYFFIWFCFFLSSFLHKSIFLYWYDSWREANKLGYPALSTSFSYSCECARSCTCTGEALLYPPMVIGTENCSMKTGNVPSLPGKIKSNKDHSSFKLFCIGEPDRMNLWGVRNWKEGCENKIYYLIKIIEKWKGMNWLLVKQSLNACLIFLFKKTAKYITISWKICKNVHVGCSTCLQAVVTPAFGFLILWPSSSMM